MMMAAVSNPSVTERGRFSWYGVLAASQVVLLLVSLWLLHGILNRWIAEPMLEVKISGMLSQVDGTAIQRQLMKHSGTAYIELPLAEIKAQLEADPWIERVELQRRWPQTLEVRVHEHRPVARWGAEALVNERGQLFYPKPVNGFDSLPLLQGPKKQALVMMRQYRNFVQQLRPLGLSVLALEMEPRGAWTLELDNGIRLRVGRGSTLERMERFSRIYQAQLADYAERIRQIDVRYTNGLTVTWKEPPRRLNAVEQ